jgi:REP element-mobilizing transposase RayT
MSQSLAKVLLHVVFSTKNRHPWLKDAGLRRELFAYMATALRTIECPALIIGGVEDHVHLFVQLSRKVAIQNLVEEVKTGTSKWLKSKSPSLHDFYWQSGYGAFSVSESKGDDVRRYIAHKEEHHRKRTFQEEFRELCQRHGVEIDERYVWG